MHSLTHYVSGIYCGNVVNNKRCGQGYPCWFTNELSEAEQPIQITQFLCCCLWADLLHILTRSHLVSPRSIISLSSLSKYDRTDFSLLKEPTGPLGGLYQTTTRNDLLLVVLLQYK